MVGVFQIMTRKKAREWECRRLACLSGEAANNALDANPMTLLAPAALGQASRLRSQ
jgi:hypothetical protein